MEDTTRENGCTDIFVYGTLMKGQRNHEAFLKDAAFIGCAKLTGYEIYDMGSYPAIVQGEGSVYGEIYRITREELDAIDLLECEGMVYRRTPVRVAAHTDGWHDCQAYVYLGSCVGKRRLWNKYRLKPIRTSLVREVVHYANWTNLPLVELKSRPGTDMEDSLVMLLQNRSVIIHCWREPKQEHGEFLDTKEYEYIVRSMEEFRTLEKLLSLEIPGPEPKKGGQA